MILEGDKIAVMLFFHFF